MEKPGSATRSLAVALGLSAALWLSACGGSSHPSTVAANTTATSQTQSSTTTRSTQSTTTQTTQSTARTQSTTTVTASAHTPPAEQRRHDHAARAAITVLSRCLTAHGIHVPPQHLSGHNPTFNTKGVETETPVFQACFKEALTLYKADGGK